MTSDIRASCGLGYPPRAYTQNANESINRVFKPDKASKCKTFNGVIKRLKGIVTDQENEVVLSLSGQGEWKFDDMLQTSRYDIREKFFQKNPNQRRQFIKSFNGEPANFNENPTSSTKYSDDPQPQRLSASPSESGILFPHCNFNIRRSQWYHKRKKHRREMPRRCGQCIFGSVKSQR